MVMTMWGPIVVLATPVRKTSFAEDRCVNRDLLWSSFLSGNAWQVTAVNCLPRVQTVLHASEQASLRMVHPVGVLKSGMSAGGMGEGQRNLN